MQQIVPCRVTAKDALSGMWIAECFHDRDPAAGLRVVTLQL
jgi:hypothetical protein